MFSNFNLKNIMIPLTLLLATLPTTKSWTFTVYPDSECDSTASGSPSGDGDSGCTATPANHRSFELSDMGSCEIYLFDTEDNCDDGEAQDFYGAGNEDMCIPPDYTWDYYYVDC